MDPAQSPKPFLLALPIKPGASNSKSPRSTVMKAETWLMLLIVLLLPHALPHQESQPNGRVSSSVVRCWPSTFRPLMESAVNTQSHGPGSHGDPREAKESLERSSKRTEESREASLTFSWVLRLACVHNHLGGCENKLLMWTQDELQACSCWWPTGCSQTKISGS